MKRLVIILIVITFVLAGCGQLAPEPTATPVPTPTPDPCSPEIVQANIEDLNSLFREWDDALEIANNTARMNLSGPVSELQALRREVEDHEVPECMADAKATLIVGMNSAIDAFFAFMNEESDRTVSGHFREYRESVDAFFILAADLAGDEGSTLLPDSIVLDCEPCGLGQPDQFEIHTGPGERGVAGTARHGTTCIVTDGEVIEGDIWWQIECSEVSGWIENANAREQ